MRGRRRLDEKILIALAGQRRRAAAETEVFGRHAFRRRGVEMRSVLEHLVISARL